MVDFRVAGKASLDPDLIVESVDKILEKLDELRDKIKEIDADIDRLSGKSVNIKVEIDGEDKLIFLRDLLDDLDARDYHVNIKVGIDGEDKLDELKLKIDELDSKEHKVRMDFDLKGADRATADLVALDAELNRKEGDFNKAKRSSDGFQFSLMSMLPLLTAAIPILAAAGGGVVALAGAFATMLPGLVGVALAAKPAFAGIQQLTKSLDQNTKDALSNASGYKQIYDILNKNSSKFQGMSGDLQDLTVKWFQLQNAYSAFQRAVDPAVFPLLGQGLSILRTLLSGLPAVTIPAANALRNMLEDFSRRLHDPVFQSFFSDMKKNTYTLVSDWSEGVLNIIEGIVAILHAFMPLSLDVSNGFLGMSKSFDRWAQGLSNSKGFQEFVDYVKKEGPIALHAIGQLVELVGRLGAALSGMGSGSLSTIDRILTDINNFAQANPGLFKVISNLLLLGFAASKILPIIAPIVEFLMTPVGAVVAGLALAAIGFVYLYNHSKAFHDWVNTNLLPMWNKIVESGKGFVAWAKSLWPDILKIWREYGPQIIAVAKAIWDFIGNLIQGAVKVIEGIVDVFLGLLTGNWSRVWTGLGKILSGAWQIIWSIVRDGFNVIVAVFQAVGKFLLGLVSSDWDKMVGAIGARTREIVGLTKGGWDTVSRDAVQWGKDVLNGVVSGWNAVTNWFSRIPGEIVRFFSAAGTWLWNAGVSIINGLANGIENAAKGILTSVLNWVTGMIPNMKGPASRDRKLLYDNGQLVMRGFSDGIMSETANLQRNLDKVTKTVAGTFGKQYTTDISARLKSSLGSAQYQMANYQQGGQLPAANSTQMHFAAGAFNIQAGKSEKPSDTITRVLQGAAKFGSVQAPVGYSIGG